MAAKEKKAPAADVGEEWVEKVMEALRDHPSSSEQSMSDYKACLRTIRDEVNTMLTADGDDE